MESGGAAMEDMDDLDDLIQEERTNATPSEASIGFQITPPGTPFDGRVTAHEFRTPSQHKLNVNMGEASEQLRRFANFGAIPESATQFIGTTKRRAHTGTWRRTTGGINQTTT